MAVEGGARRERGFALLVVLWSVIFLAFLMTQILAASRSATDLAATLRAAGAARAAEDGGIDHAIFYSLLDGARRWRPDGTAHAVVIGGVPVSIRISPLDGMVNPNSASVALMTGLLHALGAPDAQAAEVAQNIAAWRSPAASGTAETALLASYKRAGLDSGPPGKPFTAISQLSAVLGMTPALLAALPPHVSLFQTGDPDPKAADPIVLAAVQYAVAAGDVESEAEGAPAVTITACAAGAAATCRRAVVSMTGAGAQAGYKVEQIGDVAPGT
jgi:general secretion pathway protein K